ncbi:TauD/TfdA family dioxygenase [Solwaraspora sp. WMMD406]|uniref:TauD/TfdA family dioxygenase n=1 Tax=Solwaraspora sp. WMMD406 TaxID=3016095 RepID=UPI0024174B9A|nr:TauD/TfdA family dioxygenase [Solwaraspora sp. WMMD406]MDG4767688.1 TauD/TfdA family dioxygenase [Solwaraspora sp. WMMD406]
MTTVDSTAGVPAFHQVDHGEPFRIPVRDRPFLAGSAHPSFPDFVPDVGQMIPTLRAESGPDGHRTALIAGVRRVIDEALPVHGGVLLRGLPLVDRTDFERLVADLGYPRMGYQGGIAVRKQDSDVALTTTEEDPRITLSPHNEMAYLQTFPRTILFFCEQAAATGGEVPINDIRQTTRDLPDDIARTFRSRGIRYHRSLPAVSSPGQMSWSDTFGTDAPTAVERHLRTSGYEYQWTDTGQLRYHYRREAFVTHPGTGEQLWFNQVTELHCSYWRSHPDFPADLADQDYPATTTYGDGTPIDEDLIAALRGLLWQSTRAVRMRDGDVLVLDNQVLQHGRFAYQGTRRHFVSLAG